MPKKTRRMKERAAMRRSAIAEETKTEEAASETRTTLSPTVRSNYTIPTFDYSHIYGDLRRIAFFAIFFFGVLIALSFVIK
jgi:hypothetical protein